MTEYEAASLALQQASIWVAAIVGASQCSLIGYGLYIMRQAAKHRDALQQETMAQHRETMAVLKGQNEAQNDQHQETMAQHRENMAVLKGQNEAQNDQHQETMAQHQETMAQHRENMSALEGQNEALMELIRRTSASPA